MLQPPFALFRCDASVTLGIGHVRRCLTLADALAARGWRTGFAVNGDAARLVPELARHPAATVPPPGGADLVVVDHYQLDVEFERQARAWARSVAVIDDLADRPHDCDLLLDQTAGRRAEDYAALVPASARLLTGSAFALLGPRFAQVRPRSLERRRSAPCRRVLISLGGTDPGGASLTALDGVAASGLWLEVILVVGNGTPGIAAMEERITQLGLAGEVRVGVADMAGLMAECDLAIGAGGTTAWERCCLGLPTLVLITADNQNFVARMLAEAGAAQVLGRADAVTAGQIGAALRALAGDDAARLAMVEAAAGLCAGDGADKVADAMAGFLLRLRLADWHDSDDLLAWRNDPLTRATARNTDPVAPDDHRRWLGLVLADPARLLLIGERGGGKAGPLKSGMVRFDRRDAGAWEVSIALAPAERGKGLGARLLGAGIAAFEARREPAPLLATVRVDNVASRRIFEANGFVLDSQDEEWCQYLRR